MRVLVVEDDPTIVKVITTCLQLDHYEVRTAPDLPRGVEVLHREPADLILTDLFTRRFSPDAFAELAAFCAVAPGIPIVVATAHPQAATYDPATYGLAAIILKPFSPAVLRAVVQGVLTEQRRRHISADLRNERFPTWPANPRDGIQANNGLLRGTEAFDHLCPHSCDRSVQEI